MYYEEYEVGQTFTMEPISLTLEEIQDFARDYDPLPIHVDDDYANSASFGGVIASGFHTLVATWGQWIKTGVSGKEVIAGIGIDELLWKKPVYPGDVLTGIQKITDIIPTSSPKQGVVETFFTVVNQKDEVVMTVTGKELIKKRAYDEKTE